MLSQAAARPSNFDTPQRRVPNQYKMRFVGEDCEVHSSPLSFDTSSTLDQTVPASAVPPPARSDPAPRKLDFAQEDDHDDQDDPTTPADGSDGEDDLFMWE